MSTALHRPQQPNAGHRHWQQGVALLRSQRWPQAAQAFGRATRAAPSDSLYWTNLAHAQRHAGLLARAVAAAKRAVQLDAGNHIALRLLGDCLLQLHRHAEAADAFAALAAAGGGDAEALVQHGAALQALHRHHEAAEVLLRGLSLDPGLVRGHALLADACRDQGRKREAVECMKTVLALEPGNLEAMSHLSFEKRHLCDWHDLEGDIERIRETLLTAPAGLARIAAVFGLLSLPMEPELQLAAARGEAQALACGVKPLAPMLPSQRTGSKLRLGLLSYDFREHPVSQLLVEVLESFDREQFELLLYSAGPDDGSALRARLMTAATRFVDLHGLSDPLAADRIRADGVDILIDLMGHTRGHRMPIFARRPAPLQVAFLGYPGSTGADCIDYLIGDPLVTPLQLAPQYSEKLAQLPLTFQPNGRNRPLPAPMTRSEVGLPEGAFVMCAFNHTYKIGPDAFDAWCTVMHQLPGAVLWLKETNPQLRDNVLREAANRGVAPQRIVWARNVRYADHFSRLALADVFVDTWPYNAHTTAADALWAGVPVVTLYGNSFASRVAASVLNAAGIPELAFGSVDEYMQAIVALGLDPALLATYRNHLQAERMALALFDTPRYTRELQALLQRMWARWRRGESPAHLPATAQP
jgi:predicted O-linked N-acetylglucosamine transferase (SPINDLY family)